MDNQKLNNLFKAARSEASPEPSAEFAGDVMRSLPSRREPFVEPSLWEQLSAFLPRVATATVMVAVLCLVSELVLTNGFEVSLNNDLASLSNQWLFSAENLSLD